MWRPDDWKNPESRTVEDVNRSYPQGIPKGYHIIQEAGYHEGYEAGADAMFEALLYEIRLFVDTYDWKRINKHLGREL